MVEILVIFFLLFLNGVFAMFEIALVASRKSRLEERAGAGISGARLALKLLKKPENILSSIQVGITLVGIISGAYGGVALSEDLEPVFILLGLQAEYAGILAFSIVVGTITYFSLIIGELVPKTIALNNPERIAIALAPLMHGFGQVVHPVVIFLGASTRVVLYLLRISKKAEAEISEEELRLLIRKGSETGVIEKEESVIINEVIRLGSKRAKNMMTHRFDVAWLDASQPPDELLARARASVHSRLPVCQGSMDEILGVVHVKELLNNSSADKPIPWNSLLSEPHYVPEQTPAIKVLELFRITKNYFAIVVDEYGSMEGIITLHDLMENIMGDFPNLHESSEPEFTIRSDGSMLVDGHMKLEDLADRLESGNLCPDEGSVHTAAGLALYCLNRIPQAGDHFMHRNYVFEIMDMDGIKVDKILIRKADSD